MPGRTRAMVGGGRRSGLDRASGAGAGEACLAPTLGRVLSKGVSLLEVEV